MRLPIETRNLVTSISLEYLGTKRTADFTCMTFVRDVYKRVGIYVPQIAIHIPPPKDFNITKEDLMAWEHGYILFLTDAGYAGERTWTHVGITLPEDKIIHTSRFDGGQVSITSKKEIFYSHQYAPS